jgi:alpha-galactosidase
MRRSYPKLIVENCSGGSLRQDAVTTALTDTHWVSDNYGNAPNLAMIFGATYMFPPEICSHWTVSPARAGEPLDREASFTANMLGQLGLSGQIYAWDEETRKVAAERIALYKRIRARIRSSDVFHLTPQIDALEPRSMQAALYADPESGKGMLFAFQGGDPSLDHTIKLRGLKPDRSYILRMPEGFGPERATSGSELLKEGLSLRFPRIGSSAIILIDPRS